jgi:hypothetical protein
MDDAPKYSSTIAWLLLLLFLLLLLLLYSRGRCETGVWKTRPLRAMETYGACVVGLAPECLQPLPNMSGKFMGALSVPTLGTENSNATPCAKPVVLAVWRAAPQPLVHVPNCCRADVFLSFDQGASWVAAASLDPGQNSCLVVIPAAFLEHTWRSSKVPGHAVLQVGISVEDASVVPRPAQATGLTQVGFGEHPLAATAAGTGVVPPGLPQALARDLYQFLHSFDTTLPERCSPLLDRWLKRVERRFEADPCWWRRVGQNT